MSQDFEEYLAAALSFSSAHRTRDFRAGNRFADKLQKLGARMRADPAGKRHLLEMLAHEDDYVRGWAAKDCLFFVPERAVPVLDALAQSQGLISLSAMTTLDEWRAGRLKS